MINSVHQRMISAQIKDARESERTNVSKEFGFTAGMREKGMNRFRKYLLFLTVDKVKRRFHIWNNFKRLNDALEKWAIEDAYNLIYQKSSVNTVLFEDKQKLRDEAFMKRPADGLLMEFGVFKGNTINSFAKLLKSSNDQRSIYGFDSFVGFSETWTGVERIFPSSRFDRKGVHPKVEDNVELIDGFIEDTLSVFIKKNNMEKVSFIHIDTDTFSPAYTVLKLLKPFLSSGSVIVFDELLGYPNWRNHEWLALESMLDESEYEFIGFSVSAGRPDLMNAAIRML